MPTLSTHPRVHACTITLLVALAPGCKEDPTTDESGATEGSEDDVCWPEGDPVTAAAPQTITFVNNGDTPRFLVPPACAPTTLRFFLADTDERFDDATDYPCSDLPDNYDDSACAGDNCDGWTLLPSVRVEPGASYSYEWDGHLWAYESADDGCSQGDACLSYCFSGYAPPEGTALRVQYSSEGCDPATQACDCTPVDGVCMLASNLDSSVFTDGFSAQVEFSKGSGEVIVELAPP